MKRGRPKKDSDVKGKKIQELAFQMYVSDDYTQQEIAEMLGVSNETITLWKQKNNWAEKAEAAKITDSEILKKLKTALLTELDSPVFNADKVAKINSAIKTVADKKVLAQHGINVLTKFMNYLMLAGKQDISKIIAANSPDFIQYLLDNE